MLRLLAFDECALLQLIECCLQLFFGVHHYGPAPGDRLMERIACNEDELSLACAMYIA